MSCLKPSILLIDDDKKSLARLESHLANLLPSEDVKLNAWQPTTKDGSPEKAFEQRIDTGTTTLVVTDYDLTTSVKGLFGLSIVGWCQSRWIPVGDFSRVHNAALPKEPNLFELRVPINAEEAAAFIANTFRGFRAIRDRIEKCPRILADRRSLAAVLSALLDRPQLESQFAAYMSRLGAANSALLPKLMDHAEEETMQKHKEKKIRLLTYVLGHVLLNSVLKYPGPILSGKVLCAYLTTTEKELDIIANLFHQARYEGPFNNETRLFWRDEVDSILDDLGENIASEQFESFGDYNRRVIKSKLNHELAKHNCHRCGGEKGGYWCPFTTRPVCERPDCSIPASSWIPSGAQLSRVEKEFYDEWAPILGF